MTDQRWQRAPHRIAMAATANMTICKTVEYLALLDGRQENDEYWLIPGFRWAVPRALNDALASCCFARGDTLYEKPAAYGLPGDLACMGGSPSLRIVSSTGTPTGPFKQNWTQTVQVEVHRGGLFPEKIDTTQGPHLFRHLARRSVDPAP